MTALTVYLVWDLQLPWINKITVVIAFALRLAIVAPIALHLHYISKAVQSKGAPLRATAFVICKQAEICYAIMGASIPVLRPFIIATTTNYGANAEGPRGSKSGSGGDLCLEERLKP